MNTVMERELLYICSFQETLFQWDLRVERAFTSVWGQFCDMCPFLGVYQAFYRVESLNRHLCNMAIGGIVRDLTTNRHYKGAENRQMAWVN